MAVTFPCPGCSRTLRAREDQLGKKVRCPGCREIVTVPDPSVDEEFDLEAPQEAPAPPEARIRKSRPAPPKELPTAEPAEAEETAPEDRAPTGRDRPRRKRRRPRRESGGNVILDTFHYYTASFGVFPWVMAGLLFVSCCAGGVGLFIPGLPLIVVIAGAAVYNVGWFWLVITAFRDDTFHGMLCLFTHFYALAYVFINLEEAWRPACTMALGLFVALYGAVMLGVSIAIHAPPGSQTAFLWPGLLF